MTYSFSVDEGVNNTIFIPVRYPTTGMTFSIIIDPASGPNRTVTTGLTAAAGGVNLTIPAAEATRSWEGTYTLVGTSGGVRRKLEDGSIDVKESASHPGSSVAPLTVNPITVSSLPVVSTIQDRIREDFTGTALDTNLWNVVQTGAGHTVAVTASELRVDTGVTPSTTTIIRSKKSWQGAYRVMFQSAANFLSQRIANQTFELRMTNAAGDSYVAWIFDGTVTTTARVRAQNGGLAAPDTTVTNTVATSLPSMYEIEAFIDETYFHSRTPDSTNARTSTNVKNRQIPSPAEPLFIEIRVSNGATAPASTTRLSLDAVLVQDISELTTEITGGRGSGGASQAVPVTTVGSVVSLGSTQPLRTEVQESLTNLVANGTYTGAARDMGSDTTRISTRLRVMVMHTAGLVPGNLRIEQSTDGTTWRETFRIPVPSDGLAHTFETPLHMRYYRTVFVNGSTAQTAFALQTHRTIGEGRTDAAKVLTFPLSVTALGAAGTFTSATLDLGGNHSWTSARAFAASDAGGTVFVDVSQDGTNWFTQGSGTGIPGPGAATETQSIVTRFVRFRYVNGATAQTRLTLTGTLVANS